MRIKRITYYEIQHGNGWIGGAKDQYHYETAKEAIKSIEDFKANPRGKTPAMSDENVSYWKQEIYKVVKTYKEITVIKTI